MGTRAKEGRFRGSLPNAVSAVLQEWILSWTRIGALALHVSLLLVTPVDKTVPNRRKRGRKKLLCRSISDSGPGGPTKTDSN